MLRLNPTLKRAVALFLGAFALYALTAQRGLGWGDSGEFQYRVLTLGWEGLVRGCDSFATSHPLYVALCKLCCSTPFDVTLVSAFFGALAVALFYLLARNLWLAVLLALSHGLWWLSTVSEVYTMSLCFFAAELLAFKRFRETGSAGALFALAAINGFHLELHNLALLSVPVYGWVVARALLRGRKGFSVILAAAVVWFACASFWIWSFFALGPREVLWGSYGAQVLTLKPIIPAAIPLNLGLGALSLAVPAVVGVWKILRRKTTSSLLPLHLPLHPPLFSTPIFYLFAIHFLFWSTYFIASQYTFILPSAFLAYLMVREIRLSRRGGLALLALQLLLPVAAWGVLAVIGFPPEYRAWHPGRNDPVYFALPWHFTDDTASHAAALQRTPWKGYP